MSTYDIVCFVLCAVQDGCMFIQERCGGYLGIRFWARVYMTYKRVLNTFPCVVASCTCIHSTKPNALQHPVTIHPLLLQTCTCITNLRAIIVTAHIHELQYRLCLHGVIAVCIRHRAPRKLKVKKKITFTVNITRGVFIIRNRHLYVYVHRVYVYMLSTV